MSLWTGSPDMPIPWAYLELQLCRDIYHCTPKELYDQPLEVVLEHLSCLEAETEVRDFRNQKATKA